MHSFIKNGQSRGVLEPSFEVVFRTRTSGRSAPLVLVPVQPQVTNDSYKVVNHTEGK